MTILVLFILAAVWAAVLLPPWLQNRSESRPADSITSFRRQLSVLSPFQRLGPVRGCFVGGADVCAPGDVAVPGGSPPAAP